MSLFEELKRRNVFRVGIAYAVTAWLILQVADIVLDNTPAPDWVMHVIMLLLAIGLPVAVLFAWAFEMTPEGIKKEKDVDRSKSITGETRRKLDVAIIGVLTVALAWFAWDKFGGTHAPEAAVDPATRQAGSAQPAEGDPAADPAMDELPEKSIAVLPFVNMSNDPEQEFFSDGISEELLNVLAKFPGVRVAARTSSFQFKGRNQDIGEIARLLKVRHVLEGSVRKAGTQLRITAQLIRADTGYHLWSETYDRELDDVFAIQDEISAAIGEALRVELALGTDHEADLPRVAESANTAAYEAFLRGRHLVNQRGRSNIAQAVEDLKRAVRLDPEFAPAHAWMAIAWTMMLDSPGTYGDLSLAEVTERATPHIEKALELNPNLAEAHGAKALLAMNSNGFQQAMDATARALELNPVYIDAMNWRQIAASNFGDYETALAIMARMVEADPLSVIGRLNYSPALATRDLEAGREMARGLIEQHAWAGYTALGITEFQTGEDLSGSLGWFMRAYGEDPHDELSNRYLIRILSLVEEFDEARRISDGNLHIVDINEGRLESALHSLQRAHNADPENYAPMTELADALHLAGQFEQSQRYYDQLRDFSPQRLVFDALDASTRSTIRMAYNELQLGHPAAAEEAIAGHRKDLAKREELQQVYFTDHLAEAMARAIEGDDEGAFESIRTAIDLGARELAFFREPSVASLAGHPQFAALRAEVQSLVDAEHAEVLRLICSENPIPDIWQPLRATCAGASAGP
ncbi:tetratricopeptide repeat protein [Elongatibacter sediminis]|uniref:Tetratricopeptide repeat protein n=1 Tax=Elongatibacter sediminis TaxID=3119006 RepID=A0AAW9RMQ2_9GAMM